MANQKTYTDEHRKSFAIFMRNTRTEDVLRRIATAYDIAGVEGRFTKPLPEALAIELRRQFKNQNLEGYSINGRPISPSQARIVYEMVREGKYCEFPRRQPIAIFQPVPFECKCPDMIHVLPSGSQTSDEYLRDYERRLMEN